MRALFADNHGAVPTTLVLGTLFTALSTSAFVASTQDWAQDVAHQVDGAVGDALAIVSTPSLRYVEAFAATDRSHLTLARITLEGRSGAAVDLHDVRFSVQTADEIYRYDGHAVAVKILRDRDGSMAEGLGNEGDLAEFSVPLGTLASPIASGGSFTLHIQAGAEPALVLHFDAPSRPLTGLVTLERTLG